VELEKHFLLQAQLKKLGMTQISLAKRLRRSDTTIALAFGGKRPHTLVRIERFINREQNNRLRRSKQRATRNAQEQKRTDENE
jgi:hypothetical protein